MIAQVQYVELGLFVTIILTMFSLIIGGFVLLFKKVGSVAEKVAIISTQNNSDQSNIEAIWDTLKENATKMENIERQRTSDVLQFTEVIGKLNTTLGKMDVTLENTNKVMVKLENRLEDQEKEINQLKNKQ